jgi:hypothetical protein
MCRHKDAALALRQGDARHVQSSLSTCFAAQCINWMPAHLSAAGRTVRMRWMISSGRSTRHVRLWPCRRCSLDAMTGLLVHVCHALRHCTMALLCTSRAPHYRGWVPLHCDTTMDATRKLSTITIDRAECKPHLKTEIQGKSQHAQYRCMTMVETHTCPRAHHLHNLPASQSYINKQRLLTVALAALPLPEGRGICTSRSSIGSVHC